MNPLPRAILDRDGDVWVLIQRTSLYLLVTRYGGMEPAPFDVAARLAEVEQDYGPIEVPRWVQLTRAEQEA